MNYINYTKCTNCGSKSGGMRFCWDCFVEFFQFQWEQRVIEEEIE